MADAPFSFDQRDLDDQADALHAGIFDQQPPAQAPPPQNRRPPRTAPQRQVFQPMFGDHGLGQAFGGFNMAQAMGGQQAGHLQGMANDVMQAFQNENDSRVAQAREERRMAHEKELKQMEIDALLGRLNGYASGGMRVS